MHVAILSGILMAVFLGMRLGRGAAFYSTLAFLALFIAMTGFQPSAIRAGIMGGLFLLAKYLSRVGASSRTIVFAASLMLAHNPLLLKLDVGFQLSFLAMMGIIYFLPIFKRWIELEVLAMTLAAQVFTLPILIYNFGYVPLLAPVTNVLIVPLLSFIMGLGFAFGLAGMVFQLLGWIFSWPVWLLLTYIIKIVDWFSGFTFAFVTFENLHWVWLIIFYLILGGFVWCYNNRSIWRTKRGW